MNLKGPDWTPKKLCKILSLTNHSRIWSKPTLGMISPTKPTFAEWDLLDLSSDIPNDISHVKFIYP